MGHFKKDLEWQSGLYLMVEKWDLYLELLGPLAMENQCAFQHYWHQKEKSGELFPLVDWNACDFWWSLGIPLQTTKTKQNREWLLWLANKTQGTEFSVLLEPSANKTAPPVLSWEMPKLQKQNSIQLKKNQSHSEKLLIWTDLIGWEHPICLHHNKKVINKS